MSGLNGIRFNTRTLIIKDHLELVNKDKNIRKFEKRCIFHSLTNPIPRECHPLSGKLDRFLLETNDIYDFRDRKAAVLAAIKMVQEAVNNKGNTTYFRHDYAMDNINDISKYNGHNLDKIKDYVVELLDNESIKDSLEALAVHYHVGIIPDIKLSFYRTNYTAHMDELRQVIAGFKFQTYVYDNGNEYSGDWKNGFPDGEGTMSYKNGDEYTGKWKNGLRNGRGVMVYKNDINIEYTGYWVDNKATGIFAENRPGIGLREVCTKDGINFSPAQRPKVLDNNSEVNNILINLIEKYKKEDGSYPEAIEIKSKGDPIITLQIERDTYTLNAIKEIVPELNNPQNMYCLIKQDNDVYRLFQYNNGVFNQQNFVNPLIPSEPLRIKYNCNLLINNNFLNFLQNTF